ncbi:MAG TPA: hypothetical protein VKB41_06480 [Steroidobacteraceae bacterium]|jgi:hypothetical protein|nr:hypothetical protein [Steroidobacteraceae bacterium]
MNHSRIRRGAALAAAICMGVFALAHADPSNKWRIELDSRSDNDGSVTFRIAPVGGTPIDVQTSIPAKTGENAAAKLIRDSLRTKLGKGYKVEVDDGEDVLVKKKGKTPDFELTLVNSSVTGLTIKLDRE